MNMSELRAADALDKDSEVWWPKPVLVYRRVNLDVQDIGNLSVLLVQNRSSSQANSESRRILKS